MPISDCEVRDPRVRRTRQLLQGALRTLMQTKSLDEISVQEITDNATLNRVTFYDHYADKFALLDALVGGRFHQLLHERGVTFDAASPAASKALILAVFDYFAQNHANHSCERQSAFEPLMDAAVTTAVRSVILAGVAPADAQVIPQIMLATMAAAAICGAAKEWFYTPNHAPAAIVVTQVRELVLPIFKALTLEQ
jgi:AcrR family transcriptional regulator